MVYWNWTKSVYAYIKIAFLLLFIRYIYEHIDNLNNSFTESIPIGWIILIISLGLIIQHAFGLYNWSKLWLRKGWRREWVLYHVGMYLVIISIIFSINIDTKPSNTKISTEEFFIVGTWKDKDSNIFWNFRADGLLERTGNMIFYYSINNNEIHLILRRSGGSITPDPDHDTDFGIYQYTILDQNNIIISQFSQINRLERVK